MTPGFDFHSTPFYFHFIFQAVIPSLPGCRYGRCLCFDSAQVFGLILKSPNLLLWDLSQFNCAKFLNYLTVYSHRFTVLLIDSKDFLQGSQRRIKMLIFHFLISPPVTGNGTGENYKTEWPSSALVLNGVTPPPPQDITLIFRSSSAVPQRSDFIISGKLSFLWRVYYPFIWQNQCFLYYSFGDKNTHKRLLE